MEEKDSKQNQASTVQPTEPAASNHPAETKKSLSMGIKILIAALVLIILSGGAYLLSLKQGPVSKTPDKQAITTVTPKPNTISIENWKTYTNTKYNYVVKFPKDWSFREFPSSKDGAAFNPLNKPGYPDASESIDVSAGQRIGNYVNDPFEDYVKIAASKEIQGYDKLASIKKVETTEGIIGYETTWMVKSFRGGGGPSESLPITYFQLPNSSFLVRFSLSKKEDLEIYEKMLTTLSFPVSKVQSTPTPTVDETAAVEKGIKEALQAKYNSNTFVVTVSKIEGNYAKGGVSDEGGGGMWFGAKVNGVWKIVWDGNGIIQCSDIASYPDFPTSMLPECWNSNTQQSVKR